MPQPTDLSPDLESLLPGHDRPSRRQALKAALGVGYAAAALPIMAQTAVHTSAEGLKTEQISFEVNGFQVPAYVAAPAGRSNLPVILVVHEIFGVHEYIADVARRFAHAGYLAIAPDLYARQGDASKYNDMARLMAELVAKVPDAQIMADLDGAVQWAGAHGGQVKKLGITGFCWGGRVTWLYAEHNPKLKAAVAWYGRVVGQPTALAPKNPIDLVASLHAPVLGLYGQQDGGIPVTTLNEMKEALAASPSAAAKGCEFVVYPDTGHAFHADYRPSYREAAAKDGWKRALEWFRQHGVA